MRKLRSCRRSFWRPRFSVSPRKWAHISDRQRFPATPSSTPNGRLEDALGGGAYDASHLKGFLNTLKLPQFVADLVDSEMKKQNDPAKVEDAKLLAAWMTAMAKSPTAFYMGSWDFTNIARPVPHLACSPRWASRPPPTWPTNSTRWSTAMPIRMCRCTACMPRAIIWCCTWATPRWKTACKAPADADNLGARAGFQKAMTMAGGNKPATAAWVYLDFEGGFKLINDAVKAAPNPSAGHGADHLRRPGPEQPQATWLGRIV